MENWLLDIMEAYGYLGIFLLITLENIFPPIPSEIILTFGGFLTTTSNVTIFGVVIAATFGSVLGAIVLYGIGSLLGVDRIEKIIDRWGSKIRIKKEDVRKADKWFQRFGPWAVFLCRFIPLIRSLISLPAGMSKMNFPVFLVLTTLGTLIWNVVLVYLGASLGESWETIVHYMDTYSNIIYALLVILFIIVVVKIVKRKK